MFELSEIRHLPRHSRRGFPNRTFWAGRSDTNGVRFPACCGYFGLHSVREPSEDGVAYCVSRKTRYRVYYGVNLVGGW